MDAIATWVKENFNLITLYVGFVGVLVSVISYIYEMKKKAQKKN